MKEKAAVAECLGDSATRKRLAEVVRPNSISMTLRRTGVALVLAPDPVTLVPGAVLLGASVAAKKREPLAVASVFNEVQRILAEIGSPF